MQNNKPRKIAFVGTSCVGKTTLLSYYAKQFQNNAAVTVLPEVAREFFQKYPHITERFSQSVQGLLQKLILENETKAERINPQLILCDRSVIDACVYVAACNDRQGAKILFDEISFWLPTYDFFLLLDPIDISYTPDTIRQESSEERETFHREYLQFFQQTKLPFVLIQGNKRERIERINTVLQNFTTLRTGEWIYLDEEEK